MASWITLQKYTHYWLYFLRRNQRSRRFMEMWPACAEAATCQINQLCDCCQQLKDFFLHFKLPGLQREGIHGIQMTTWYCSTSACVIREIWFFSLCILLQPNPGKELILGTDQVRVFSKYRQDDNDLSHYLPTFYFLHPHTENKCVHFFESHRFCWVDWLKADGRKNRAAGGGALSYAAPQIVSCQTRGWD